MDMNELKTLISKGETLSLECKKSGDELPKSIYETYSAFANTNGGYILLGVVEDKESLLLSERFSLEGVPNAQKLIEDFWNTINSDKVNENILKNDNVFIVEENGMEIVVIYVPRAEYNVRPIYIGENPYKGTFKRNREGDYHASKYEVDGMIRDRSSEGNDASILEYYSMDDIDKETLKKYRQRFEVVNLDHIWNSLPDKEFIEQLGGYRKDRRSGVEGLTVAGLLMFGKGKSIRERFSNILMDYQDKTFTNSDLRWNDRITYDGTWENNLYNFFFKVTSKLTEDLKKPFKLEGIQRIDDSSIHKALREGFINSIIHADYTVDSGTLKVIKGDDYFEFVNPGILKLPLESIYHGGNSKSRNPHIQTMFRMIGYGDNAGSGFPTILEIWKNEGWTMPSLSEDTIINQVTLIMKMGEGDFDVDELKDGRSYPLSKKEKEMLQALRNMFSTRKCLTTKMVSDALHMKESTTRRYMAKFVNMGTLRSKGKNKATVYLMNRQF